MSGRLGIIGGSDAGIAAGLRARELDASAAPTLLLADAYPNFSICGLPYLLSGEVSDWRELAHRTRPDLEEQGLRLVAGARAERIDPQRRLVFAQGRAGPLPPLEYDRLIVATGAAPVRPPVPGLDNPGVFTLHTMDDAFAIARHLEERRPRSAVVVGAGYIGCEMADALTRRGVRVTLVEQADAVLGTVDPELGVLIRAELGRHGVEVQTAVTATGIAERGGRLRVAVDGPEALECELVLVVVGVQPNSSLAADAGAAVGPRGALRVDRQMRTSLPDVWAAGDCVQTHHRLLSDPGYLPLGSTAHKQGRVAGENAVGGRREFAGSVGTQVVKIFDLAVAGTGLRERVARSAGFEALTVESTVLDHKAYYPGAQPLTIRVCGDRESGRLLGAQIAGHHTGQVAKRIDTFAVALHEGLGVNALSDLDLSYTPPFGAPWDPIQTAAQAWGAARSVP